MAEFVRVPFEKVSINKIIKQAGISRGSFYTYFEDKEELLAFILEDTKEQWFQSCLEGLRQSGGDFFVMMETLMDDGIRFCIDNNLIFLHRNLIMYHGSRIPDYKPGEEEKQAAVRGLLEKMDRSKLRDPSERGCANLLQLALSTMIMGIAEICTEPEREEEVRENFRRIMRLLRDGAYVNSEKDQMED